VHAAVIPRPSERAKLALSVEDNAAVIQMNDRAEWLFHVLAQHNSLDHARRVLLKAHFDSLPCMPTLLRKLHRGDICFGAHDATPWLNKAGRGIDATALQNCYMGVRERRTTIVGVGHFNAERTHRYQRIHTPLAGISEMGMPNADGHAAVTT